VPWRFANAQRLKLGLRREAGALFVQCPQGTTHLLSIPALAVQCQVNDVGRAGHGVAPRGRYSCSKSTRAGIRTINTEFAFGYYQLHGLGGAGQERQMRFTHKQIAYKELAIIGRLHLDLALLSFF
jgi:hypothetical protein